MRSLVFVCVLSVVSLAACRRSNNILLGRVEAKVGPYVVVVTDCYRFDVPAPGALRDPATGDVLYTFAPCRDADVRIEQNELSVNGVSFGHVQDGDTVLVDHGTVIVNGASPSARWARGRWRT